MAAAEVLGELEAVVVVGDAPAGRPDVLHVYAGSSAPSDRHIPGIVSESSATTSRPLRARDRARVPLTVDFPEPPLPATAIQSGSVAGGRGAPSSRTAAAPERDRAPEKDYQHQGPRAQDG